MDSIYGVTSHIPYTPFVTILFQKLNTLLLEYRSVGLPSSDLQEFGLYLVCLDVVCASQRGHFIGLAYCITTSGTTGTPKIVRVPHSCIIPNVFDFRLILSLFWAKKKCCVFTAVSFELF